VDDFQLAATKTAYAYAMAADPAGNVYAAGGAADAAGVLHGTVREKLSGSANWTTIADLNYPAGQGTWFNGLAMDAAGDLYVSGGTNSAHWLVLERPAGQSTFSVVGDFQGGYADGLAVDAAGNLFAVGPMPATSSGQENWVVRRRAAGQSAFTTVDSFVYTPGASNVPNGVTAITSGPNAGVYVAGYSSRHWLVRKSTDGGNTWALVDDFKYDPASNAPSGAFGLTADPAGNLYVVGRGQKGKVTGGTAKKPTYTYTSHWLVRGSSNGGASWSLDDDYELSSAANLVTQAYAAGTDAAGNVYAAGKATDATGTNHSIVRSNAGGSWATVDDYQAAAGKAAQAYGFAADSSGNLYVGGQAQDSAGSLHWFVRSAAGPAPAAFSTTAIVGSSATTQSDQPPTIASLVLA
jgi:hypothetical protein